MVRCPRCASCFDADLGTIATPVALEPPAAAPSDSRAKKRARDEHYNTTLEKKKRSKQLHASNEKKKAVTVQLADLVPGGANTTIIIRLAQHLTRAGAKINTRRVSGRGVAEIRDDVRKAWPSDGAAIVLPGETKTKLTRV